MLCYADFYSCYCLAYLGANNSMKSKLWPPTLYNLKLVLFDATCFTCRRYIIHVYHQSYLSALH